MTCSRCRKPQVIEFTLICSACGEEYRIKECLGCGTHFIEAHVCKPKEKK